MRRMSAFVALIVVAGSAAARADCPLDHFIIGRNRDGIEGTADDMTLFVDCRQKYRHSGPTEYESWFYPLHQSIFPSYPYRIGEPGFDAFQQVDPSASTFDPNHALRGEPDLDYRIIVECIAVSPGLRAVHKDYPQFTIAAAGESFDHSSIHGLRGDSHIHLSYQGHGGEALLWMTLRVYDGLDDGEQHEPSEPLTIVFNAEPAAGDLCVDHRVDPADVARFAHYWLSPESSQCNDFCERADMNRDGLVDFTDFARLASNWRQSPGEI